MQISYTTDALGAFPKDIEAAAGGGGGIGTHVSLLIETEVRLS